MLLWGFCHSHGWIRRNLGSDDLWWPRCWKILISTQGEFPKSQLQDLSYGNVLLPPRCQWSILTVRPMHILRSLILTQLCRRGATWAVSILEIFPDYDLLVQNQPDWRPRWQASGNRRRTLCAVDRWISMDITSVILHGLAQLIVHWRPPDYALMSERCLVPSPWVNVLIFLSQVLLLCHSDVRHYINRKLCVYRFSSSIYQRSQRETPRGQ